MEESAKNGGVFLVKLGPWEWVKTETVDGEPQYDFSVTGRLFSAHGNCPLCGGVESLQVCASACDECNTVIREYCCLSCEDCGDVSGSFGDGALIARDERDDHFFFLPSHVVLEK